MERLEAPSSLSQLCARPPGWGRGGICTLQRQASPVVPKLPRSSQRIISWSGGTKQVLVSRWEWDRHCLGRQGQNGPLPEDHGLQVRGLVGGPRDGGCDTHWWACTSRLAGWGCPHIRGHNWGREQVVSGIFIYPQSTTCFPQPPPTSITSHSGGLCSLGHMRHTWLGHPCPGSRYLRICGDQVDRTWGRAAAMGQARSSSPTLRCHMDSSGLEA